MSYKPILFNTEMVKAILDGRKTQTRRTCKGQGECNPVQCGYHPPFKPGDILWVREAWCDPAPDISYSPILYKADFPMHWDAEETEHGDPVDLKAEDYKWRPSIHMPREYARIFLRVKDVRAERLQNITEQDSISEGITRLYDNLTSVEYEIWAKRSGRFEKQSEWPWNNYLWHGHFGTYGTGNRMSDAWPYQFSGYENPRDSFSSLWNSTVQLKDWHDNGWAANPWVWVIEFERVNEA